MKDYVVEPPDLLVVELLEGLPGRPISGERLVRPDGKISLGFYGDIYIAGLTLPEIKEKIVLHLRKYLADETLGLAVPEEDDAPEILPPPPGDPSEPPPLPSGDKSPFDQPREDAITTPSPFAREGEETKSAVEQPVVNHGKFRVIQPKDTTRVFVDVTAYNSKNYYIQGEVVVPGKMPITGTERILDAISYAGGLTPEADHEQVFLYREVARGQPAQTLEIDIDQIMLGDDLSTNYQLLAGDKVVIRRRVGLPRDKENAAPLSPTHAPKPVRETPRVNREPEVTTDRPTERVPKQDLGGAEAPGVQRLEKRMREMEKKLDLILERIKKPAG